MPLPRPASPRPPTCLPLLVLLLANGLAAPARAQPGSSGALVAAHSGLCIGVPGGSTAQGAPILQATCTGGPETTWTLQAVGNNRYHLLLNRSGLCLNVFRNSQSAGSVLVQWPCQGSAKLNDQWTLAPVDGRLHLVSASSGQCVNVYGAAMSPGAAVVQWPCQGAAVYNDQFTLRPAATALPSAWSPVIPLPVNPIGAANLPNGKLVLWSADQPLSFQGDAGYRASQTWYAVFDPRTGSATTALETSAGSDMFCPGTALLPDGRLLVNGGSSSPRTSLYDWRSDTWSAAATMNVPRGYQGDTLLSSGAVLTLGGSWSGGQGGKTGEVWTEAGGWRLLPGVPETPVVGPDPQGIYRGDNHLWLVAQAGGRVFHAGPSAEMHWIDTAGDGSIRSAGMRGDDAFSINGNAVLYDIGKILKVGGAPSYQQNGTATTYAGNAAYVIDISAGFGQPAGVTALPPMAYRRAMHNSVVLPNGQVVVVGGQAIPQPFTDTAAVLVPELWDPATGRFSTLAPMRTPRTYHSTALLLEDGRVFVGGGGQCGTGCAENHLDAEILTPPYLLSPDGTPAPRPTIRAAPATGVRGQSIAVGTDGPVTAFALMRLAAVTHTTNNDQRRIPLAATATGTNTYALAIPADPGIVLPGYYMLFALDARGVPSIAATLQIP